MKCFTWNVLNYSQGKRFSASGKRGFHPCFCLPVCCNCPVALSEFATYFTKAIQLRIGKFQKMQLQQEKQIAISNLLRKCGLLAHTSAAFLKNCCTEKLFSCLRLVLGKPPKSGSARLGHIPSLPWESQLPLKPCISLQPLDFKGNCDSSDCSQIFVLFHGAVLICFANVGCSPTPRQHF